VDSERGSVTPLILLFFCIAALVVMAGAATSSAFLAQRDLQAACDGAAIAAANAVDPASAYAHGLRGPDALPLSPDSVQQAVDDFAAKGFAGDAGGLALAADTDGRTATVTCHRTVRIPFGAAFGHADGLDRTALASARSPLRD
jgi:uncharacterized membrane protein